MRGLAGLNSDATTHTHCEGSDTLCGVRQNVRETPRRFLCSWWAGAALTASAAPVFRLQSCQGMLVCDTGTAALLSRPPPGISVRPFGNASCSARASEKYTFQTKPSPSAQERFSPGQRSGTGVLEVEK